MTKKELKTNLTIIEAEYKASRYSIIRAYISTNNPYKIGDILEADVGYLIKVETMKYYLSEENPQMTYNGVCLKKDLTPMKNGKKDSIYQSRVKRKLN